MRYAPAMPVAGMPASEVGEAWWTERFSEALRKFCRNCDAIATEVRGESLWQSLSRSVVVGDGLEVSVLDLFRLDSAVAGHKLELDRGVELLPVPFADSEASLLFKVSAWGETREVTTVNVSSAVMNSVATPPTGAVQLAAAPLLRREYASWPMLEVSLPVVTREVVGERFKLRQLLPTSSFTFELPDSGSERFPETLRLPGIVTVDVMALKFQLIGLDRWALDLEAAVAKTLASTADPFEKCLLINDYTNRAYVELTGSLTIIRESVTRAIGFGFDFSWREEKRRKNLAESWTVKVRERADSLKAWLAKNPDTGVGTLEGACARSVELISLGRQDRVDFIYPATLVEGELDLGVLAANMPSLHKELRCRAVQIPYSAERDPGTLGKRSSALLMCLALMLLGTSFVDLTCFAPLLGHIPTPSLSEGQEGTIRQCLVALLLIFPAALYGQFFQTRPKSPIGANAQSGSFATLSLMFACPILPAAMCATGVSLAAVSFVCMGLGVVTAVASVMVWTIVAEDSLARLRRREILKGSDFAGATSLVRGRKRGS